MVVKRRLLLAVATAATLVLGAAMPAAAAFESAKPNPLRKENLLRVQDIEAAAATKAHGSTVAIGWREASRPGVLFLTYSVDGGKSYRKPNGKMRKARIAGDAKWGMSLAICDGRIWVGTVADLQGTGRPTDVLLSSKEIVGGAASQGRLTSAVDGRRVRDVSIGCVGNDLLAIGWLENNAGKRRVRLMLRSLEPPTEAPSFRKTYGLGEARFKGGLAVAASSTSVHVAWAKGARSNIVYKRFLVGDQAVPEITKQPTMSLAWADAEKPQMAARGTKLILAFRDAGRIRARISTTDGASFRQAVTLVRSGTKATPSKVHSVDVAGRRVVAGVSANRGGALTSQRIWSDDLGKTWSSRSFGNDGARVAALLKRGGGAPLIREAWHNDAPGLDRLRAQYETY